MCRVPGVAQIYPSAHKLVGRHVVDKKTTLAILGMARPRGLQICMLLAHMLMLFPAVLHICCNSTAYRHEADFDAADNCVIQVGHGAPEVGGTHKRVQSKTGR